jgi:hypothetical protein
MKSIEYLQPGTGINGGVSVALGKGTLFTIVSPRLNSLEVVYTS